MARPIYIGLDSSTTATKAIAWSADGQSLAEGRSSIAAQTPNPGFAEQDAGSWWKSARLALRQCLAKVNANHVKGVGITVQRETFVLLDRDKRPLRPAILWYDARAAELLPALARRLGRRRYHQATGKQFDVTSPIGKLAWIRRHEPALMAETAFFADVMAYLALQLTGELATTWASADTTGLIGLASRDWHAPHLRAAGLQPDNMPLLVAPGELLGTVTKNAASATGLRVGTPIVAGGGDGHCFALGAGRMRPRMLTVTLGTGVVMGVSAKEPIIGPYFRTLLGCAPGQHLLESVIQSGSATLSWLHDTFLPPTRASRRLGEACEAIPAGSEGLLVLPYWRGVRAPHNDPLARGVTVGWTDRHTAAHFERAIMEGVALELASLAERIQGRHELTVKRLVAGGGGAASDCWCQILADCFHLPCLRPATVETASLGAALLAMASVEGIALAKIAKRLPNTDAAFKPNRNNAAVYDGLKKHHARLYQSNRQAVHHLARQ